MKSKLLSLAFFIITLISNAQVAINSSGNDPDASAMLDIVSNSKGLLIPRMSASDRDNISNPATGLLVYVTDDNKFYYYDGTEWVNIVGYPDDDWKVDGNNMYSIPSGNVGIGNTSPSNKLSLGKDLGHIGSGTWFVVGSDNDYPGIAMGYDGDNYAYLLWHNQNKVLRISTKSDGTYYETIYMKQGRVGIRESDPLYTLDVSGSIRHSALLYNTPNNSNGFYWFSTRAASNNYGDIIAIQGGGTTIVGGGESAFNVMNNITNDGHETLYLASDRKNSNIAFQFISSLQDGWDNRKEVITVLGNGNTGFGLNNPVSTVHIAYTNDAGPNGSATPGGDLTIGDIDGIHLEMDNNEIHAMNGSDAHNLYLNADGGRVVIGSNDHAILDVDNLLHLRPSTAPANPIEGDIYYDQDDHALKVYTNNGWKTIQMY